MTRRELFRFGARAITGIVSAPLLARLAGWQAIRRPAVTMAQITTVSYPKILADYQGKARPWGADSALFRELGRDGYIARTGSPIEVPLEYGP